MLFTIISNYIKSQSHLCLGAFLFHVVFYYCSFLFSFLVPFILNLSSIISSMVLMMSLLQGRMTVRPNHIRCIAVMRFIFRTGIFSVLVPLKLNVDRSSRP